MVIQQVRTRRARGRAPGGTQPAPHSRRKRWSAERVAPYLFMTPAVLTLLVFRIYPLLLGINFSFTGDGKLNGVYVGLANYTELLHDERFRSAVRNVLIVLLFVPIEVFVAGILATFIFLKVPGHRIYRGVYFLPVVFSPVIIGAIFNMVLAANGPLNQIAQSVGLPSVDWLGQAATALPTVLAVEIWATFGMGMIIFLAGLSTLDMDLLDAARIDGANLRQSILHVIVPGLSRTIQFVFVTTTIGMLTGMFGLLYTMTAGGPGTASYLPEYLIWDLLSQARPALASAASMTLLLLVLFIALVQIRILRRATKEV